MSGGGDDDEGEGADGCVVVQYGIPYLCTDFEMIAS